MPAHKQIYLDYNATTPLLDEVIEVMKPYWADNFGNPSSNQHTLGWKAEQDYHNAQKAIAAQIKCHPHEVYFTSGATESNNWVIWGVVQQIRNEELAQSRQQGRADYNILNQKIHIISSNAEHKSILEPIKNLAPWGIEYDFVEVDSTGKVDPQQIQKLIRPETKLISIMWANNELGTINPIIEIGQIARQNKIYFHTDATQSIGKIECDFNQMPIDLMTFSAHKLYGPKGVGALIVRKKNPTVQLAQMIVGGGQQNNLRSGTINISGIVGFAKAVELMVQNMKIHRDHYQTLRSRLVQYCQTNPHIIINTPLDNSIENTLNLSFENIDNMKFLNHIQELATASSSACLSGSASGSHVLAAIGRSPKQSKNSIRISLGIPNTLQDIDKIISIFKDLYNQEEKPLFKAQ